jgi:hypothetical protein
MIRFGKGYRTLAINGAALVVAMAAGFGIGLDPELVKEAALGILALLNIALRFDTDTKVGG